jgi:hypothetical protein
MKKMLLFYGKSSFSAMNPFFFSGYPTFKGDEKGFKSETGAERHRYNFSDNFIIYIQKIAAFD